MHLLPWEFLNRSQKFKFIKENYRDEFNEYIIDDIADNILRGILPNGEIIEVITLTPEVETLRESYSTFLQLPKEIPVKIAYGLTYDEVLNLCETSSEFNEICESKVFWIDYIRNILNNKTDISFVDMSVDELMMAAKLFYDFDREKALTLLRDGYYTIFSSLSFARKFVNHPLKYAMAEYNDLIDSVTIHSSQDHKDLALIIASDLTVPDDEKYYEKAVNLIKLGSNPQRQHDYLAITGRGRIALSALLWYEMYFGRNNIKLEEFNIENDSLLELFQYFGGNDEFKYLDYILNELRNLDNDGLVVVDVISSELARKFLDIKGVLITDNRQLVESIPGIIFARVDTVKRLSRDSTYIDDMMLNISIFGPAD